MYLKQPSSDSTESFFFFFLSFFVFFLFFSDESDELDSTSFAFFLFTARTPATRLSTWPVTNCKWQLWHTRNYLPLAKERLQSHPIISQPSAHHIGQWWWAQWACRQMWSSHLLSHPATWKRLAQAPNPNIPNDQKENLLIDLFKQKILSMVWIQPASLRPWPPSNVAWPSTSSPKTQCFPGGDNHKQVILSIEEIRQTTGG